MKAHCKKEQMSPNLQKYDITRNTARKMAISPNFAKYRRILIAMINLKTQSLLRNQGNISVVSELYQCLRYKCTFESLSRIVRKVEMSNSCGIWIYGPQKM